jgi:hypothetical protein
MQGHRWYAVHAISMQTSFPSKPRGDIAFHGDEADLLPVIDIVDIYVLMCGGY